MWEPEELQLTRTDINMQQQQQQHTVCAGCHLLEQVPHHHQDYLLPAQLVCATTGGGKKKRANSLNKNRKVVESTLPWTTHSFNGVHHILWIIKRNSTRRQQICSL